MEVWSEILYYPHMEFVDGVRKDLKNIYTYKYYYDSFGLRGEITGPSRTWIIRMQEYTEASFTGRMGGEQSWSERRECRACGLGEVGGLYLPL